MSAAPFNPSGYATSSSQARIGAGVRPFALTTATVTLTHGGVVQAVPDQDSDQWMIGVWDAENGQLLVGRTEGKDFKLRDLTGLITLTDGSANVSGTDTLFTSELAAGDVIARTGASGTVFHVVSSIASDTSLTLTAAVSGTQTGVTFGKAGLFEEWLLRMCDSQQGRMDKNSIEGLRLSGTGTKTLMLSAGKILSLNGLVEIEIDQPMSLNVETLAATGNIAFYVADPDGGVVSVDMTEGDTTLTAVSGDFTSPDIWGDGSGTNADYVAQGGTFGLSYRVPLSAFINSPSSQVVTPTQAALIYVGGLAPALVTPIVPGSIAATTMELLASVSVSGNPIKRGGRLTGPDNPLLSSLALLSCYYAVVAGIRDSDGAPAVRIVSLTADGVPDFPAGYSNTRTIGVLVFVTNNSFTTGDSYLIGTIDQPLVDTVEKAIAANNALYAPKAVYAATITPTLLSGNIASRSGSVLTWSTSLAAQGVVTGDSVIPAVGGTWPTGATTRGALYIRMASATTFTLHSTLAGALTNTDLIVLTADGSGTRTMHKLVHSDIGPNFGVSSVSPIGGSGTYETTVGFAVNFDPPLPDANRLIQFDVAGLATPVASATLRSLHNKPSVITVDRAVFRGLVDDIKVVGTANTILRPSSWLAQATTSMRLQLVVY